MVLMVTTTMDELYNVDNLSHNELFKKFYFVLSDEESFIDDDFYEYADDSDNIEEHCYINYT